MRPQDWPALLDGYVGAARRTTFAWGTHDCVTFVCGWHALMTGRDVYAPFRGTYGTDTRAHRVMLESGVHGMEEAGRFLFGEPRKNTHTTQRGDIVYGDGALGICIGAKAAFLSDEGLAFIWFSKIELAWSI